jgi:hypothetical protein
MFDWRMILYVEDAVAVCALIEGHCRGCRRVQPIMGDHDYLLPGRRGTLMDKAEK